MSAWRSILDGVSRQPSLIPEQRAERQRDLPMIIAFCAGRKRTGVSQNNAPLLDKFRGAVSRRFRDGRIGLGHDAHPDQAGARHSPSPMMAWDEAVIAAACAFCVREATWGKISTTATINQATRRATPKILL
jgi:hypothetical protein